MRSRIELERIEELSLSPGAVRSAESKGRIHPEPLHPYRTSFQRDRDRIIHSTAFRRLEYKTQVFIYHEGDYYRNRLTHTIEVQQIARTLARGLGLNEDLAEAISLAHDIGHTPFGHKGEYALQEEMKRHGKSFEHNRHGLRIVDLLEKRYPSFDGLNLSWEVREGIVRHSTHYDTPETTEFSSFLSPSLECQIVNKADAIAYTSHDIDDGIQSKILDETELAKISLWNRVLKTIPSHHSREMRHRIGVRTLINILVSDILRESSKKLTKTRPNHVDEVRAMPSIIAHSQKIGDLYNDLNSHLFQKMYNHYRVIRMAEKASRIIHDLFEAYIHEPRQLPAKVYQKIQSEKKEQVICDYLAGMTDRFALDEYARLFDPHTLV
jgi:dGTPase